MIADILHAVKGDITEISNVQAIVNAANETLLGGGGVDGAIHRAAGPELLTECRKAGGCEMGDAKLTGAYKLPCDYVIHTVGPRWCGGYRDEAYILKKCYISCLSLALEHDIRTIAFPSISTGAFGYPAKDAAQVAVSTVFDYIRAHPNSFDEIYWVLFDDQTKSFYERAINDIKAKSDYNQQNK